MKPYYRTKLIPFYLAALFIISQPFAWCDDTEWPPAPDPGRLTNGTDIVWNIEQTNPDLETSYIEIDIPDLDDKLIAWHSMDPPIFFFPVEFTVADIEGDDDGDVNLIVKFSLHWLVAYRLDIQAGTYEKLWELEYEDFEA